MYDALLYGGNKEHIYLFVPCSPFITCWERTNLLALLCVVFSSVRVTFPYGVSGQVLHMIELIPDLCLPLYLEKNAIFS